MRPLAQVLTTLPGRVGAIALIIVVALFLLIASLPELALRTAWWEGLARTLPPIGGAERVLQRPPALLWVEGALVLALGGLAVVRLPRQPAAPVLRLIAGLGLTALVVSAVCFSLGVLFDALTPLIAVACVVMAVLAAALVERDRARMRARLQLLAERADRAALEGALEAAARMQASLLPAADWSGEGVAIACHIRSAETVGGDFYDYMRVPGGRLFFLVADVSGHGAQASQFMVMAKTLWKSVALREPQPLDALVAEANEEIERENRATMFVTALAGLLDPGTGELRYVGAGHEMPWVLRADGRLERLPDAAGPPIGLVDNKSWPVGETYLAPTDRLVIFTDGLTEAVDINGNLWGTEGVEAALNAVPRGVDVGVVRATLVERLERFTEGAEQADDQTLMVVGMDGARA